MSASDPSSQMTMDQLGRPAGRLYKYGMLRSGEFNLSTGISYHLIGGAGEALGLDAKTAILQAARLASSC